MLPKSVHEQDFPIWSKILILKHRSQFSFMSWYAFDAGKSIGKCGSEGGVTVRDEEHGDGARITLERNSRHAPFAITCGVYGWMFHTRFLGSEPQAQAEFESMKAGLAKILHTIPLKGDPDISAKSELVFQLQQEFVASFP
jgi:hypothetical protein